MLPAVCITLNERHNPLYRHKKRDTNDIKLEECGAYGVADQAVTVMEECVAYDQAVTVMEGCVAYGVTEENVQVPDYEEVF